MNETDEGILKALNSLNKRDRDPKSIAIFINPNYELVNKSSEETLEEYVENKLDEFEEKGVVKKEKVKINRRVHYLYTKINKNGSKNRTKK